MLAIWATSPSEASPEIRTLTPKLVTSDDWSPLIPIFLFKTATSAFIARVWFPYTYDCEIWLKLKFWSTVIVWPETAVINLFSDYLWLNPVEATTIVYPTFQSFDSETVKVFVPATIDELSSVHYLSLAWPNNESLQLKHPITLFPKIGSCLLLTFP